MPKADLASVCPGRAADDAAAAAITDLAGWRLSTGDDTLAEGLVAAGAQVERRAHVLRRDLSGPAGDEPSLAPFTPRPVPLDRDRLAWEPILPSWHAAFPPGHPDHLAIDEEQSIEFFMRLVDGSDMGVLHRSACVVADPSGHVVAGIMVNIRPDPPPWGGAWIADIWRDPSLHGSGLGSRLMGRAMHQLAQDGLPSLTLAVTHGNDAALAYERLGFRAVTNWTTVRIP
ncbi:MAG: GNAT family N-acetyltransferase [Actinomycetota bacterium]|nr:GNAT family N-acetyltransferase [Actinomycetota bacterium]